MIQKIYIRKHELGLWFRRGDFKRLLGPGAHWLPGRLIGKNRVLVIDTFKTEFRHPLLDLILQEGALRGRLLVLDLSQGQRALLWKNGRLGWILGPGRHAFWKAQHSLEAEVFDVRDPRLQHGQLDAVLATAGSSLLLETVTVGPEERAVVTRGAEVLEVLDPGVHAFWKGAGTLTSRVVDLREQVADVAGQEIMTSDKVTLRINLLVTFRVTDPVRAVSVVDDFRQALYRQSQLALREAVGTRPLERLLTDKQAVGNEVRSAVAARAAEFGVVVVSVGLRDLILPGDMKSLLNQVIEAQKAAEANLIRRREETAAARSQANTARLLADNPVLLRMKELEALQEILKEAKTTFVFGQGDIGKQIRALVAHEEDG